MEKELYYTNNKLKSKLNIYFDLSQFNDIANVAQQLTFIIHVRSDYGTCRFNHIATYFDVYFHAYFTLG